MAEQISKAERRLLDALRQSVEAHGHPAFTRHGGSYARDNRAVIVGYHDTSLGRLPTTVSFRQATLDSLRSSGLIDASLCPVPAPSESRASEDRP